MHTERLVHKLVPATPEQRRAVEVTRALIWWLYADLKAWALDPCPRRAATLRARFDRIFRRQTNYATLDRLLARLHRRKQELLRVLERPEIPLHTNGSENDIRACVTKRKVSGGTMSTAGRTARDVLLGPIKTCNKLKVSFFRYLGDRLHVPGAIVVPPLSDLVRQAAVAHGYTRHWTGLGGLSRAGTGHLATGWRTLGGSLCDGNEGGGYDKGRDHDRHGVVDITGLSFL